MITTLCENCDHGRYEGFLAECQFKGECGGVVCEVCGNVFSRDDVYDNICYDCAKDSYDIRKEKEFVQHKFNEGCKGEFSLENEFVNFMLPDDNIASDVATDIIFTHILNEIRAEEEIGKMGKYRKSLEEFCMKECDLDMWIDFLHDTNAVDDSAKPKPMTKLCDSRISKKYRDSSISTTPVTITCSPPNTKICCLSAQSREGCSSKPIINNSSTTPNSEKCSKSSGLPATFKKLGPSNKPVNK